MKKNIILVLKGFIMGIANIIPGVSGGTLALTLGIYEEFIGAISHFLKDIKNNLKFLVPIAIGMGLSILTMSNVISFSFDHYPIPTTLFFMGLVIGGIPMLYNKVKGTNEIKNVGSYVIFIITFLFVMMLAFSDELFGSGLGDANLGNIDLIGYLLLFFVGLIAAATMVIPGVSGSLVLMLLGYYQQIINTIKDLTHFNNIFDNVIILGVFGLGVLIGIVLVAKLIEWLFKKYEIKTYFGVLGFILASVVAIPVSVLHEVNVTFDVFQLVLGVFFILVGIIIGNKLGQK